MSTYLELIGIVFIIFMVGFPAGYLMGAFQAAAKVST